MIPFLLARAVHESSKKRMQSDAGHDPAPTPIITHPLADLTTGDDRSMATLDAPLASSCGIFSLRLRAVGMDQHKEEEASRRQEIEEMFRSKQEEALSRFRQLEAARQQKEAVHRHHQEEEVGRRRQEEAERRRSLQEAEAAHRRRKEAEAERRLQAEAERRRREESAYRRKRAYYGNKWNDFQEANGGKGWNKAQMSAAWWKTACRAS